MHDEHSEAERAAPKGWGFFNTLGLTDQGLLLGAGSVLVRMAKGSPTRLALDPDRDRLTAMLSVVRGEPVESAEVLRHVEAASRYWQRGDKALANLRLVFARLPSIADASAIERLTLAEEVLNGGVEPAALMQAIWPDARPANLDKYAVDQPRVPAGNGDQSGRWTREGWVQVADNSDDAERHPSQLDDLTHGQRVGAVPSDEGVHIIAVC